VFGFRGSGEIMVRMTEEECAREILGYGVERGNVYYWISICVDEVTRV